MNTKTFKKAKEIQIQIQNIKHQISILKDSVYEHTYPTITRDMPDGMPHPVLYIKRNKNWYNFIADEIKDLTEELTLLQQKFDNL